MKKFLTSLSVLVLLLSACASSAAAGAPEHPAAVSTATSASTPALASTSKEDASWTAEGSPETACPICEVDMSQYNGPLDQQEVQGLLMALNDEYRAWATYGQVIEDFGQVRPFVNIQEAEARHIEALLSLFRSYDVPIPENPWIGNVPRFGSVKEACAAGVDAEIENRELYDELFESTDREDILRVYRSLQRASDEQHLPAFQRCAER